MPRMGTQSKAARSLALAKLIIELESELKPMQAKLAEMKEEYARLVGEDHPPAEPKPVAQSRPVREGTVSQRILALFELVPGPLPIDQVCDGIPDAKRATVEVMLHKLVKDSHLDRVAPGLYAKPTKKLTVLAGGE